jgi:protein SCO1/2
MQSLARTWFPLLLAVLSLFSAPAAVAQAGQGSAAKAQAVKRYAMSGKVLSIDLAAGSFTVAHDAIPGFMPAMTMPYKVKNPAVLKTLVPGDRLTAVVIADPASDDFVVDEIVVTRHEGAPTASATHLLRPGDLIPDLSLVNQDGRKIHLGAYRGRALLITFIYTRCPMPKACPMISSHFARVHALLARDAKTRSATHLLSITLDPDWDTPAVLRSYGLAYLQDDPQGFQHWEFARASTSDLHALADAFGLEFHEENRQILHTVRTLLIGPDGRLLTAWDGSAWKPQDVADAVAHASPGAVR